MAIGGWGGKRLRLRTTRVRFADMNERESRAAIYRLRSTVEIVDAAYEESQGEVTDETGRLESLHARAIEDAAEVLAGYVRGCERTDEILAAEIAALQARCKDVQARHDWAKGQLREVVMRSGTRRIDAGPFSIRLQAGRERVEFSEAFDLFDLPDECKKTTVEPRKSEIAKLLKAGVKFPGVSIGRGEESVVVK